MKAALACLVVGSAAGIYAFANRNGSTLAEALHLLGFALGLAFLFREIRQGCRQ